MKRIGFIIVVIFLFSCNQEAKTPEYVIPSDEMVNIISDIHITDGLLTLNHIRRKLAKDSINYYDAILNNHGYSRSDFDSSVSFYSRNIDEYDKIYEEVLNRLNKMETNIKQESVVEEAKKEEEKKERALKKEEPKKIERIPVKGKSQ